MWLRSSGQRRLMLPIGLAGELVSIGTLVLRVRDPDLPRPFKAPAIWLAGRRHSRLRARDGV